MSKLIDDAIARLRAQGLRITDQRRSILRVLTEAKSPMSAEETHVALKKEACDLVTAYRCLEQFEKAEVVELGVRENGTKVYCLAHGQGHHHHLTCRSCGRAERVDLCMGKELEEVATNFGFVEVSHVMEVFGLCPDCK
ncbi:MAG: Fur family transcriptional regulator [Opitutales bacterium]|nr:Fur family transcriptional regulator [Opitutales bacterium]